MALLFPANPSSGDTYQSGSSSTYQWTGTHWRIKGISSGSILSTRLDNLESFSSSLDAAFATDSQLASLSASLATRIDSAGGAATDISALNAFTASAATTGSNIFIGNQIVTGSLNVTGSVNINNVIKLAPITNFPNGQAGMLVASASYGKTNLYMYDGSNWKWLVTGSIA